ncbi:hypothetical protein F511_18604 [Dorcoceras hygrometricum]|uniref:Uncharacterized protein n=1 Tax=Dorcoceras hygrometricum TaxID=472368 RepID=A0A2Z7A6B2_9LAMI|nr:hypothetical protein F511_18604 [Dorcoceras hygrometricum]
MVKRLVISPHDPLGITDSACKNQSVMVSLQYGPFNTYIPIRSTTIGISRVARDPITMHTSWRSNSDIACVTSIGYPRTRASGESSTTKHRLLHASGPHPIPPPNDPIRVGKRVKVRHLSCRVSMTFRVVRTNQYNQDLELIHSTNGNHLESPNEGSSIDHQVTIHLHAQNITMFPTKETWYFASQMLVSISGGLILILTAQSTRNEFRIHIASISRPTTGQPAASTSRHNQQYIQTRATVDQLLICIQSQDDVPVASFVYPVASTSRSTSGQPVATMKRKTRCEGIAKEQKPDGKKKQMLREVL